MLRDVTREELAEIIKEAALVSLPGLVFAMFIDFFAGIFMGKYFEDLMKYAVLLVILPGLMGLRGNIFGALASRFTTMLHLGEMEPSLKDKNVRKNVILSIILSMIPLFILWTIGALKIRDHALASLAVVVTSTLFATLILAYTTAGATIIPFKKGIDPDAIAVPLVTATADLITIPLLVTFLYIYEHDKPIFLVLSLLGIFLSTVVGINVRYSREDLDLIREILGVIGALAMISSITGSLLQTYSSRIQGTVFTIMYPVVLASLGNIGSIIGSKTSTRVHLGEIEGLLDLKTLIEIVVYSGLSLPLAMLMSIVGKYLFTFTTKQPGEIYFRFILSYPLVAMGVMFLAYFLTRSFEKMGLDPDNVTVPTITTLSDIISTLFIVAII
ncbi:magnesium transporter [Pyrococcus sp. ST04]|uniref:magnesium transporter n=1 Tax=Pyrococcus sp. ST04 TaxID=1183377 RepID=UPI0002605FE1|nr:magnesium transporter [Pyrococcus sp. ST04]AFK22728.1 putative magnesium transporter [Pyrococcus sp. ST04]